MSLKDYITIPDPKTVEGQCMKWTDYIWLGGGWIGWIALYWLLFIYRFLSETYFTQFNKNYLFGIFFVFGLILTKSATHYRKNWNGKFKRIKSLWISHYTQRNNEIYSIYGKLKYLHEEYEKKGNWRGDEWIQLLRDFNTHIENISDIEEIKSLKGDIDYHDET